MIDVKKDLHNHALLALVKENNKKKFGKKVTLCRSQKNRVFQNNLRTKNDFIICGE
jgi:hypothetical protein